MWPPSAAEIGDQDAGVGIFQCQHSGRRRLIKVTRTQRKSFSGNQSKILRQDNVSQIRHINKIILGQDKIDKLKKKIHI